MESEDAKEKIEIRPKNCKFQKFCEDLRGPRREWPIDAVVNAISKNNELTIKGMATALNNSKLWINANSRSYNVFVLERGNALKWYTGKIKGTKVVWHKWYKDEKPSDAYVFASDIICVIYHAMGKYTMEYRTSKLIKQDNGLFKLTRNPNKSKNLFTKLM